jgi:5-methylcytosine-specific restriction endonuclease McrA
MEIKGVKLDNVFSFTVFHGEYYGEIWRMEKGEAGKPNSSLWRCEIWHIDNLDGEQECDHICSSMKDALHTFMCYADEDNEWDGESPLFAVKVKERYKAVNKARRPSLVQHWARLVKHRDGKCVNCGSKKELNAHHVESYAKNESLRFDVNNGITLCRACHIDYHKVHGK